MQNSQFKKPGFKGDFSISLIQNFNVSNISIYIREQNLSNLKSKNFD